VNRDQLLRASFGGESRGRGLQHAFDLAAEQPQIGLVPAGLRQRPDSLQRRQRI